jgi:glucans biosynthesis protein
MKVTSRFENASDTPRRFAPPLLIEGIKSHAAEVPLYQEGCPSGRGVLAGLVAIVLAAVSPTWAAAAFDFSVVEARARALAAQPHVAPAENVPAWMQELNYDRHRAIVFDPDHAWWRREKLPFQLQFFHPGWLFKTPVRINEVVGGEARPIQFSADLFKYGKQKVGEIPPDLGFAGLRIHYPLVRPTDELAVFLGASYFRSVGRGLQYGLSARGLAINTGEPVPEEFPRFVEFWVERPAPGAAAITLHALLDSPSVVGAYRLTIRPGDDTVMDVKASLFFRGKPAVVGLAPLSSMYQHGENTGWSRDDFRPEVHDSDGLLMHTGAGEWLWRPLTNPAGTRVSSFQDRAPRGFGLLQRDREFAHYDDIEANYHQRPSAWIEPVGDWGEGAVRLLEFHTADETNDNIAACWVPARLPPPGVPLTYSYRLHWMREMPGTPPAGYVVSTRQGVVLDHPERRRFVVDFAGLHAKPGRDLRADLTVVAGASVVPSPGVSWIEPLQVWRVAFELVPEAGKPPVELRLFLRERGDIVTETWSNLWNP